MFVRRGFNRDIEPTTSTGLQPLMFEPLLPEVPLAIADQK
jgi:hypothetical protein